MTPIAEYPLGFDNDHIEILLRGRYNLQRLRQAIKEVGRRCRESHCRRVLADAREHVGGIDILDLHQIGEQISRELPRGSVVAVVVSVSRLEMDRHLETVAVNRGVLLRLFTDTEEARFWLEHPGWKPVLPATDASLSPADPPLRSVSSCVRS